MTDDVSGGETGGHEIGRTLLPETVKHYLETIFYIEHEGERVRPGRIAEWMGLTAPTVSVTLRRLRESGWIEVAGDRTVKLSPKGEELAQGVVRVHRTCWGSTGPPRTSTRRPSRRASPTPWPSGWTHIWASRPPARTAT